MAYAKAIAAFITPFIITLLMPLGVDGDTTITQFIEVVIMAIATALTVYMVPNKS